MKTFVVRIWVPAEPEYEPTPSTLRGLVERVGTGRSEPFTGVESLVAFLSAETDTPDHDGQAGGADARRPPETRRERPA